MSLKNKTSRWDLNLRKELLCLLHTENHHLVHFVIIPGGKMAYLKKVINLAPLPKSIYVPVKELIRTGIVKQRGVRYYIPDHYTIINR